MSSEIAKQNICFLNSSGKEVIQKTTNQIPSKLFELIGEQEHSFESYAALNEGFSNTFTEGKSNKGAIQPSFDKFCNGTHGISFGSILLSSQMLEHFRSKNEGKEINKKSYDCPNDLHATAKTDEQAKQSCKHITELADIVIIYRCKSCNEQYDSESSLLNHAKNCKKASLLKESPDDIIIARCLDSNIESFSCGKCMKVFNNFNSCQAHIKLHGLNSHSSTTDNCSSGIKPALSLSIIKVESDKSGEIPLDTLKKLPQMLKSIPDLVDNLETSNDSIISTDCQFQQDLQLEPLIKNYKCAMSNCGQKFHSSSEMKIHEQCHNSEPAQLGNKFKCLYCDKYFCRWGQCAMHLFKAHRVASGLLTCAICRSFKTYTTLRLRQHQETHSDKKLYNCPTCNKGFKQAAQLINHKITHVPPSQRQNYKKSYQSRVCDLCNKTFATPKIYNRHVKQVHDKVRPWWCDLCGHTAATKHALEVHKRIHTGEKPYACDLCSYKTADHNTLRRHKMKHDGIKPYSCPHCPYTAIQSYSFKSHIKNYHPNLPGVFECPHCPFQAVRESSLKSHIQSHNKGLLPVRENIEKRPEDTVFPGNLAATQLLYNCLSALAENGEVSLPNSLESSICQKGSTQTITIHIPQYEENSQESVELPFVS